MNVIDALGLIPRPLITIDFEAFYSAEFNLRKCTTEEYVRDPRFEALGVGVKVGVQTAVWLSPEDFERWAAGVPWRRVRVLAQHAHLEALILSHRYNIRPGFWLDTLSMSRALHGPGGPNGEGNDLDTLARYYGVGQKGGELAAAKGKRRRDFTPEEWLALGGYCCNDDELTFGVAAQMVPAMPLAELWLIDSTVRMFSEPQFRGNVPLLEQAAQAERDKKAALLRRVAGAQAAFPTEAAMLEAARAKLASNPQFAALLKERGIEPPTKPGKNGTIFAFAKNDPGMQALLEHPDSEIQALAEARVSVKSTIIGTRTERFAGIARRGAFPIYLNYGKAHTHRWSGGDSQNAQNLNRGGVLRDSLEAADGYRVVAADSGQIEARKLAWLAREERALETFRHNDARTAHYEAAFSERKRDLGREPTKEEAKRIDAELAALGIQEGDFYSDKGSLYFGKRLSKKDTPTERQVAKAMELGLGYQMGTFRFGPELLKGLLGLPPMQFNDADAEKFNVRVGEFEYRIYGRGVVCGDKVRELIAHGARLPYRELLVHCAVADHFVQLYRRSNPRIVAYWETMSKALAIMAQPGEDHGAVRERIGPLEIMHCAIRKPSGLVLHYPRLRREGSEFRYWGYKEGRMQWCKIYGGLLTENVDQSLSRDVVAEQALWIRAAGFPPATLTHDEIVCIPREEDAERCLSVMLEAMKRAPAWCADLPLNASGGIAKTYGAAK